MRPYLLSRGLDPFLGLFTGFLAFYLHETHPRTARREEDRLMQLLEWKYRKYQKKRQASLMTLENSS